MRIEYDKENNVAYLYFEEKIKAGEVKRTVPINDDELILDLDKNSKVLGIEFLDARKSLPSALLRKQLA